jgi:pimeloyl-ACP methyl ester carboxylesterase
MRVSFLVLLVCAITALPSPALNFTQRVDHFSADESVWTQRWYSNATSFGGPGYPIIVIMGGEEALPPSKGILYPSIVLLAARLRALIIEPEHRFFGASQPLDQPFNTSHLQLLTPQQALADSAALIEATREAQRCTGRNGEPRCPVITAGGSYPGWQAFAMRLRYPALVDMAYAASPALGFYNQAVDAFAYYARVTASAARAAPACPGAVRAMLAATLGAAAVDKPTMVSRLNLCSPLPPYLAAGDAALLAEELSMLFQISFANLNMGNYPPPPFQRTRLLAACEAIEAGAPADAWAALSAHFSTYGATRSAPASAAAAADDDTARAALAALQPGCFNLSAQMPSGPNASISAGDWSGVGAGDDGSSWDFMTCLYLVEPIGTNNVTDMFLPRAWSYAWLDAHCKNRFNITPQPRALPGLWGTDQDALPRVTSHIVFTNGLNDGWSVGGVTRNLSDTLLSFNMPNGAHHSDLNYIFPNANDTADVTLTRELVAQTFERWLAAGVGR